MGSNPLVPEAETAAPVDFQDVQLTPEFKKLRRTHRSFVFPMAIGFLLWYFAYVLLADYAHEFMATPVWGNINVGLLLGLLQFVSTFGITTWYVTFANRRLDPQAKAIRTDLEARIAGYTEDTTTAGESK